MDQAVAGVLVFAALGSLFFAVIGIVMYILLSLGLYTLAKNRGFDNPWLAWIPIGNFYILGKLVGTLKVGTLVIPKLEMWLPIGFFGGMFLGWIPILGWLIGIAAYVYLIMVAYKLFKLYRPQSAVLFTVLAVFFAPIMIFIIRNDTYTGDPDDVFVG